MKILLSILTVLMLISAFSQTSDRLYAASKGDTVKYDSAAVLEIEFYRLVRKQVNTGMGFIDTLQFYIKIQHEQQIRQEKIISNLIQDISISEQRLTAKDSVISFQNIVIQTYYDELNKPKPKGIFRKIGVWFENSWEKILVGMGIGALFL